MADSQCKAKTCKISLEEKNRNYQRLLGLCVEEIHLKRFLLSKWNNFSFRKNSKVELKCIKHVKVLEFILIKKIIAS